MAKFTIGIFGRGTNPHAACFEDYAYALRDVLRALGHETTQFGPDGQPLGRLIMFGVNNSSIDRMTREARYQMPPDAIVFNTEQLSAVDDPTRFMANYEQYRQHVVWDYSRANIEVLKKLGITRAVHCPLGYYPTMASIEPAEEDIDVLFYGSTNPHRLRILDALDATGLNVKRLFGVYGKERDVWIARSKVVLNMHHYERGVFEIFRVSHLVANRKCVVSEDGGVDEELNEIGRTITCSVPYAKLVEACVHLAKDDDNRRIIAETSFEAFSKINLLDNVRRAIEQS